MRQSTYTQVFIVFHLIQILRNSWMIYNLLEKLHTLILVDSITTVLLSKANKNYPSIISQPYLLALAHQMDVRLSIFNTTFHQWKSLLPFTPTSPMI